ncbi:MAG: hypothetical protein M1837_001359 [Sclerophora amabilis]|nr:MAG: hypothetical protein M1837_001359 [Sclerophora amabilis]
MSHKRPRALYEADLPQGQPQQQLSFVSYGTALPPLDSSVRDDGSYVPVWKQEVTDEQGRKRLHGAFTGGFSAGYFNTVGSKEGWTPSTFVSSRSNRRQQSKEDGNEQQQHHNAGSTTQSSTTATAPAAGAGRSQQRPEDFMDAEDLADLAESQRLQTSSTFSGLGSTESELASRGGRGSLMDVFKTSGGDTMGTRLLRRMGWREGQGVGARVWRRARGDDDDTDIEAGREGWRKGGGEGEEGEMHSFAPRNVAMVGFVRKSDSKGLGFRGEVGLNGSSGAKTRLGDGKDEDEDGDDEDGQSFGTSPRSIGKKNTTKTKKDGRRGAFGVGILNDTGSDDDDDPYEMGPRISYSRMIGGDKQGKKKLKNGRTTAAGPTMTGATGTANPLLGANKPVFISKKVGATTSRTGKSGFRKCHDGRLPLDGFLLASDAEALSSIVNQDGRYPPPEIPKDWKSTKQSPSSSAPSRDSVKDGAYQSVADAAKASTLDAKARASLLGETQLPSKSVFDFLSPAGRDRLASASGKNNLPAGLGEPAPKGFSLTPEEKQKELQNQVPQLDKEVAIKALGRGVGGWMPYAEDEGKRARYRGFLEGRAGLRAGLPERPPGVSKDDWINELREFAHAAQIFKPMTGMMASRFTSSSTPPAVASDAPDGGPSSSSSSSLSSSDALLRSGASSQGKPEDPAEAAAKAGMYGPMTRSVQQFFPTRLLCKRFNVKAPSHVQIDPDKAGGGAESRFPPGGGYQPGSSAPPPSKSLALVSNSALDEMARESGESVGGGGGSSTPAKPRAEEEEKAAVVVDAERNEALEAARPGDAVFKAIFGSDDEDEED